MLGFAFCKASSSAVHPAGQRTAQRFVSICNPLPWFTLTNRYLKFANTLSRHPHLASRSRRCLRRGVRTNAIPSSFWKSFKKSSLCVYTFSTSKSANLLSIQFHSCNHENRHVGTKPEVWGSTDRRTDIDMEKVDTTERLARLRELMKKHKVDIYSM